MRGISINFRALVEIAICKSEVVMGKNVLVTRSHSSDEESTVLSNHASRIVWESRNGMYLGDEVDTGISLMLINGTIPAVGW